MRVNKLIATVVISALMALEAWTLKAVVDLKVQIAQLAVRVDDLAQTKTHEQRHIADALTLHP